MDHERDNDTRDGDANKNEVQWLQIAGASVHFVKPGAIPNALPDDQPYSDDVKANTGQPAATLSLGLRHGLILAVRTLHAQEHGEIESKLAAPNAT